MNMWRGDSPDIAWRWIRSSSGRVILVKLGNSIISVTQSVVGSTLSLGGSGWRSFVATTHVISTLYQGWANSDPRAKCGPSQRFKWPAEAFRKCLHI